MSSKLLHDYLHLTNTYAELPKDFRLPKKNFSKGNKEEIKILWNEIFVDETFVEPEDFSDLFDFPPKTLNSSCLQNT